jgi:hypothetical protein
MNMEPPPTAHEEAKRNPNGWVYKLDGNFGPNVAVPPKRIVGAWKVDGHGLISGEFIPNPNYRPLKSN